MKSVRPARRYRGAEGQRAAFGGRVRCTRSTHASREMEMGAVRVLAKAHKGWVERSHF